MKRLSIIVPLFNSEKYLPKCLDSLLDQDIPEEDYEIILVNDGSPDGSLRLAQSYASKHANIVVLSQANKGTSGARNTGLRHASGKYIYFVDPDDYILANSLKKPLEQMDAESLDVLRFGYTEVDEQYRKTHSVKHPEQPDYSSTIMDGCTFMAERLGIACYVWTFFFRTTIIIDNHLFFYEGDYFDDTPWLPRVLQRATRVNSIDTVRHFYLIRQNSLIQSNGVETTKKKIDGQMFLISELNTQKNQAINPLAEEWYRMMISHCVITLLSLVAIFDLKNEQKALGCLRQENVLPISTYRLSWTNRCKAFLINVSPTIFCRIIHYINHK